MLKERWNDVDDSVESFLRRPRYRRLYEILKKGNVEVRVVSRADAPFLHGKAGVIRQPDGSATAFMGSLNETREGWSENYELVWEDSSADGVAWVEEEFEHLWNIGKPLPDAIVDEIGRSARRIEVQLEELGPEGRRAGRPGRERPLQGRRAAHAMATGLRRPVPSPSGSLRQGTASSRRRGRRREDPVARRQRAGQRAPRRRPGPDPLPRDADGPMADGVEGQAQHPVGGLALKRKGLADRPRRTRRCLRSAPTRIVKCPRQIAIVSTGMIFQDDRGAPSPAVEELWAGHSRRGAPGARRQGSRPGRAEGEQPADLHGRYRAPDAASAARNRDADTDRRRRSLGPHEYPRAKASTSSSATG